MKFYYNLYMSKCLVKKKEEMIQNLTTDKWQMNKYLLVLTRNERNHLEFFDSVLLNQKMIEKEGLFVVGIADGYPGALELVEYITDEVYRTTNGTDIRGYLLAKQQEYEESNV